MTTDNTKIKGAIVDARDALIHGLDRTKKWCHYQGDSKTFHAQEIAPIEQALAKLDALIAAVPDAPTESPEVIAENGEIKMTGRCYRYYSKMRKLLHTAMEQDNE